MKSQKSQYTGVYFDEGESLHRRWHSVVSIKGTPQECGYYATEREAAVARDKAILRHRLRQPLQILKKASTTYD